MKPIVLIALLFLSYSLIGQPARTKEQTTRLNTKNGFRSYIFGTPLNYFINKIDVKVQNPAVHSKFYKLRNEDLNISSDIKAEWIIYGFTADKLDEVTIQIEKGSKQLYEFLFREYGEPDVRPSNVENKKQLYEWRGSQAQVLLYYSEGKEGAVFTINSGQHKDSDTDIRQGF